MILGTGDWAYVAVGIAVPLFGFLGLWLQARRTQREVASPNGQKTGEALYESRKMLVHLREQMAEVREAQLAGWERAAADTQTALDDRIRLEAKVDQIVETQEEHLARDDSRFGAIFTRLELDDPVPDDA